MAHRLFVAAWPSDEVVQAIEALDRPAEPGVRWTGPAQWHVTLRFLGDAEPDEVAEALDTAVGDPAAAPVTARIGPAVSLFGRNVVCLPVSGLDELAGVVRSATAEVGEPPDPRPFAGHLTLARLKGRAACGVAGTPFSMTFDVDDIHLVASERTSEGARYTTLRSWPLEAPAAEGSSDR